MKKDLVTASEVTITITKDELETLDWGLFLAEQDARRKTQVSNKGGVNTAYIKHEQQWLDKILQARKELNQ